MQKVQTEHELLAEAFAGLRARLVACREAAQSRGNGADALSKAMATHLADLVVAALPAAAQVIADRLIALPTQKLRSVAGERLQAAFFRPASNDHEPAAQSLDAKRLAGLQVGRFRDHVPLAEQALVHALLDALVEIHVGLPFRRSTQLSPR